MLLKTSVERDRRVASARAGRRDQKLVGRRISENELNKCVCM